MALEARVYGAATRRPEPVVRMRVAFLISVHDMPFGGHYHTLKSYVEAMPADVELVVYVIGHADSPVLRTIERSVKVVFIRYTGVNLRQVLKKMEREVAAHAFDVYHAYDEHAYMFARWLAVRRPAALFLTRCGGPNPSRYIRIGPRRYFPKCQHLIVFSQENYTFFQQGGYADRIELIEARVPDWRMQGQYLRREEVQRAPGEMIFLRITRIGRYYYKTLMDSIRLVEELNGRGIAAKLLVVGRVYEQCVVEEVLAHHCRHVMIVSDDAWVADAKQVIGIADFVIGTGRSAMEAMAQGKPVLVPVANGCFPRLVRQENVEQFVRANFSERAVSWESDQLALRMVMRACQEGEVYKSLAQEARCLFRERFDIRQGVARVLELYEAARRYERERRWLDLLVHTMRVSVLFVKTRRRMRQYLQQVGEDRGRQRG